jgi:glycosyltransferase involved in cell wall biosynthesis
MKILFITNELNYACGVTTHLLNLTSGIAEKNGNEIHIIAGGGNGADRFDNKNYTVIINPDFLHENRNPINFTKAVSYLVKYTNNNLIEIIHSHTHYAANIAYYAASFINVPKIQTNHGILPEGGKLTHFKADKYIAINEHIYEYLRNEINIQSERISFIRCGIPVPDAPPVKDNSKLKIISASRLTYDKGTDIFIDAVSMLNDEIKRKSEFYIAGDGEEKTKLMEMNNSLNAGVHFLGRVDNMQELLSGSNVFVFCGRSLTEGFPAIITEAGAYNNLVISSDFKGLQPAFEPDKDGLVFKANNAEKLCGLLDSVINNFEEYIPLALNYYNKVKKLYSVNEMVNKHLELYNSCRVK